jgi:hypothetical protein
MQVLATDGPLSLASDSQIMAMLDSLTVSLVQQLICSRRSFHSLCACSMHAARKYSSEVKQSRTIWASCIPHSGEAE